jgi:hypothetical protein
LPGIEIAGRTRSPLLAVRSGAERISAPLLTVRKRMSCEFIRRRDGGAAFSAVLADVPSAAKRPYFSEGQ